MSATDRVFGALSSLAIKAPCRVATTANITLSGEQTIDGVAVVTDDRVLVKDQSDQTANGIYVADTSAWERAPDCDGNSDLVQGSLVYVAQGSANALAVFRITTANPITIGTSNLAFSSMGLLATPVAVASGGTGGATAVAGLANLGVVQVTAEAGTDTITGTVDALVTAYRADQLFLLVPAATNTGATTFNPTPSGGAALGAKNVFSGGAACVGGELRSAVPALLHYDGTQFNIIGPFNGVLAFALVALGLVDISGAAAGQIKFPATQNPSADANTLDDYEEGNWTPTLGGSATYTEQVGKYTKTGRSVTITCSITVNAIGTGSQSTVSGLPFTCADHTGLAVGFFSGLATACVSIYAEAQAASTAVICRGLTAAAAAPNTTTLFTSSSVIHFSGTYRV